jgi:hypothetical protein
MSDLNIQAMLDLGRDALSNLYDLVIDPVDGLNFDQLTLRINDFTPPESSISTYERHYKTRKIEITGAKIEQDNQIDIEFRVDQNWDEYRKIVGWRNKVYDPKTGQILGGSNMQTTIKVLAYANDANEDLVQAGMSDGRIAGDGAMTWVFENAMPIKIATSGFTREGSDVVTGTITFLFTNFYEEV